MKSAPPTARNCGVRSTPGPSTLTWVTLLHLMVILGFVLIPIWLKPKPQERFIEVVDLGTPDPAAGSPEASAEESAPSAPPAPAPSPRPSPEPMRPQEAALPPPPATPIPPPTPKPEPVRAVAPPPKPQPPLAQKPEPPKPTPSKPNQEAKPKPPASEPVKTATPKPPVPSPAPTASPTKPAPRQIAVNTTVVKRTPASEGSGTPSSNASATTTQGKREAGGGGLDPAAIQKRLAAALPTVGVTAGTGQGRPGTVDASSYHALIRSTLERNWVKPTGVPLGREALVRVRIQSDGTVTPLGISRSSGDATLDGSALEAVRRTGRLSRPLPEGLGNPDYEVVVNFKLE